MHDIFERRVDVWILVTILLKYSNISQFKKKAFFLWCQTLFHFLIPFPCLTVFLVLFWFTARCQMSWKNFDVKLCFHFLIPFLCLTLSHVLFMFTAWPQLSGRSLLMSDFASTFWFHFCAWLYLMFSSCSLHDPSYQGEVFWCQTLLPLSDSVSLPAWVSGSQRDPNCQGEIFWCQTLLPLSDSVSLPAWVSGSQQDPNCQGEIFWCQTLLPLSDSVSLPAWVSGSQQDPNCQGEIFWCQTLLPLSDSVSLPAWVSGSQQDPNCRGEIFWCQTLLPLSDSVSLPAWVSGSQQDPNCQGEIFWCQTLLPLSDSVSLPAWVQVHSKTPTVGEKCFDVKLGFHFLILFPCLPGFQVHSETRTVGEKCFDVKLGFHFLIPFPCLTVFFCSLQVHGETPAIGEKCEPLYLTITYGNPSKICQGFPKNMALGQLRCVMSEYSGIEFDHLQLNVLVNKGKNTQSSSYILSTLCCWWLIWPIQNFVKKINDWIPCIWVLIWVCSTRSIQWIQTWQGLDGLKDWTFDSPEPYLLYAVLILWQFNWCVLCAPMESTFIKLHILICTSNLYACIVLDTHMINCHSSPVRKNETKCAKLTRYRVS